MIGYCLGVPGSVVIVAGFRGSSPCDSSVRYLSYLSLAVAAILALWISGTEEPAQRQFLIGWAGLFLGAATGLSGLAAMTRGRVLVATQSASREIQPVAFWFTVCVLRFGVAAVLLVAGVGKLL